MDFFFVILLTCWFLLPLLDYVIIIIYTSITYLDYEICKGMVPMSYLDFYLQHLI